MTALVIGLGLSWPPAARAGGPGDSDGDGLPDAWEERYGLNPASSAGDDGAAGDPDGDGVVNAAELAADTHPRGFHVRRLAEGAHNAFFAWRLAIANPHGTSVRTLVTFLQDDGVVRTLPLAVPAKSRHTLTTDAVPDLAQVFSVTVESDLEIAIERAMTWSGGVGSHAETGIARPALRWYLAEGATGGGFNLFYLLQNPGDAAAAVTVTFLRPAPAEPLVRRYDVPARSRYTIWVDEVAAELAATDVSADISSTTPIVVERAMYFDHLDVPFRGGHAATGVTAVATDWFLAEGATGTFFELFVLIANPSAADADALVSYLLPDGTVLQKTHRVAARSRHTIWVDHDLPELANTPVSVRLTVTNGVGVVVERTMWWSDGAWREAHNSPGTTTTGTRWLAAEGEAGGPDGMSTYVLVANTSAFPASLRATVLFEGGSSLSRSYTLAPTSRFNIDVAQDFPSAAGRRFSTLVESLGAAPAQIVVEQSIYSSPGGVLWEAGTNALAMRLASPLLSLPDVAVFRGETPPALDVLVAGTPDGEYTVTADSSAPAVAAVRVDPQTRALELVPGTAAGTSTITVAAQAAGTPPLMQSFTLTVRAGALVQFAPPVVLGSSLFPAAADFDGDGRPELAGTSRGPGGALVLRDLRAIGLGPIVDLSPTSRNRDNRVADFNGDGRLDIVTHTYTGVDDGEAVARLFFGQADGTFAEDPAFTALGIRGYGETIVTADFDNDGDLDLFLPQYTNADAREQFWFLLNDGTGRFVDVADPAGIATRGWPFSYRVEGAQALDFDGDGDLDLFAASHFYFNEGVAGGIPRFVDRRAELGLPLRFDEGLKFFDFDADGRLDLLQHHPNEGPQLWRFTGTRFEQVPLPAGSYTDSFGANVHDVNGDGLEDIILAPGRSTRTRILLNTGSGFVENPLTALDGAGGDAIAFADFDGDRRIDVGRRAAGALQYALNATPHTNLASIVLEIVDRGGERNQQGRVVRITPEGAPAVTYTRVVDGGSGLLSQNEYALLVGTPYSGRFFVRVRFAGGERQFVVRAGERLRLFSDGAASAF